MSSVTALRQIPALSPEIVKGLRGVLAETASARGSQIVLVHDNKIEPVLEPDVNNVAGICKKAFFRLEELAANGKNPFLVMVSSGQSCTTCHSKQEIWARDLMARKLLAPNRFVTLYGATYDETFRIAQFNDAPYADAMIFHSMFPNHPDNLVRHELVQFSEAPFEVRNLLREADGPTAAVVRDGKIYAIGRDTRDAFNLFRTPEANAVREACLRHRRQDGVFDAWTIDGDLYTTNMEIGPLLFGTMGWTHINTVKSVVMPPSLRRKQFETRETPEMSNAAFLRLVAMGYHNPRAAITVLRDEDFVNTAQPKWAEMLKVNGLQLYNGSPVRPMVEAIHDAFTRYRFAAYDIRNCCGARRPLTLLEPSAQAAELTR